MHHSLCTCTFQQFFDNDQHSTQQLEGTNLSLIFVLNIMARLDNHPEEYKEYNEKGNMGTPTQILTIYLCTIVL